MHPTIPDLPASFRDLLTHYGFDWEAGRIILQEAAHARPGIAAWSYFKGTREVSKDDPLLDWKPKKGFPGGQMPRFVAFDKRAIYFPRSYECMDTIELVFLDPAVYIADWKLETPYSHYWNEKCPTLRAERIAAGYFRGAEPRR